MKLSVLLFALLACIFASTAVKCQETAQATSEDVAANATATSDTSEEVPEETNKDEEEAPVTEETDGATKETDASLAPPVQSGPFIDLLGPTLLSLEMIDESHAQLAQHYTNEALSGKNVIGLYFRYVNIRS